jgi:hypothetical protein
MPKINTPSFKMFNVFKFRRFDEQSAKAGGADFELSSQQATAKEYQTSFTSFDNPIYRDQVRFAALIVQCSR